MGFEKRSFWASFRRRGWRLLRLRGVVRRGLRMGSVGRPGRGQGEGRSAAARKAWGDRSIYLYIGERSASAMGWAAGVGEGWVRAWGEGVGGGAIDICGYGSAAWRLAYGWAWA